MTEKFTPTAKVVDGLLILSLPDAICPVVWQMDVTQSKSSALEVRPNEGDATVHLVLKTPRQDVLEVAQYQSREQAVKALLTVSAAMERAHGQIHGSTNGAGHGSRGYDYSVPALYKGSSGSGSVVQGAFKFLGYGALGVILLAITFGLVSVAVSLMSGGGASSPSTSSMSSSSGGSSEASGQSMSAEDFLQGR